MTPLRFLPFLCRISHCLWCFCSNVNKYWFNANMPSVVFWHTYSRPQSSPCW